jgi:S-DNA-T family DNA segregation ATPase FtsK/SpoIIIE
VRRSSGSGDDAARDPSDLARICRAAHSAMGRLGLSTATPPWLPPLPEQLAYHAPSFRDSHETPWPGLTLGLADLPQQQSQVSASWLLDEAHLAIAGGPRSGRTTAVRTLAHAIADAPESAGELHAYILDGANALADLEGLPNVESVIRADDLERADRLLRRVRSEIEARRPAAGTEGPADQERGRVILLIDGWETLLAAWAALDHGVMLDDLTALLREGVSIGVHVAITGGRALLTGSVSSLLGERMVLRFADPADALLAGVPTALTRIEQKAGRAIWTGARFAGATEVQIALPPPAHALPPAHAPRRDGWTIPELPRQLSYAQLQAVRNVPDEHYLGQDREIDSSRSTPGGRRVGPGDEAAPNRSPRRVIVGIGGDDASPMALDLDESPVTLVLGPARSGRSTALRCIAEGLRQLTEPAILLRSGPLERRAPSEPRTGAVPVTGTGPTNEISLRLPGALEQLSAALSQHPGGVVLVDDVSLLQDLGDGPADAIGRLLSAQVSDHGGAVVLASSVPEVLAAYRGPLTMARGSRSGLLLGPPSAADGEVFALRLRRRPVGPPGRALLISAGRAHCLQVALPPDSSVVHATAAGQLLAQG